jgi:hypothetical protein
MLDWIRSIPILVIPPILTIDDRDFTVYIADLCVSLIIDNNISEVIPHHISHLCLQKFLCPPNVWYHPMEAILLQIGTLPEHNYYSRRMNLTASVV